MKCCLQPTQCLARDSIDTVPLLQEADRLGHFGITNYNAFILQEFWRQQKAGYMEQINSLKQQMELATQVRAEQAVAVVATTKTTADERVGVGPVSGQVQAAGHTTTGTTELHTGAAAASFASSGEVPSACRWCAK